MDLLLTIALSGIKYGVTTGHTDGEVTASFWNLKGYKMMAEDILTVRFTDELTCVRGA